MRILKPFISQMRGFIVLYENSFFPRHSFLKISWNFCSRRKIFSIDGLVEAIQLATGKRDAPSVFLIIPECFLFLTLLLLLWHGRHVKHYPCSVFLNVSNLSLFIQNLIINRGLPRVGSVIMTVISCDKCLNFAAVATMC